MAIPLYTIERIKRVCIIALITSILIAFFAFAENKSIQDIELALLVGFFLGIVVGILEEFYFVGKFRKLSIVWTIAFKSILYTIFIAIFFYFLCMDVRLFWLYFS